jgi:hypothetical protein
MISKNFCKQYHYLDRDTDINKLAEEMMPALKTELVNFLTYKHTLLQDKDAGAFVTLEHIVKAKEGELDKMLLFFRGPVVEYYFRQKNDHWNLNDHIPAIYLNEATDEIKRMVGFTLFDHTGLKTDEVNSMVTFTTIKALNEFLHDIEGVCFDDMGYIFPDSAHFKALLKEKGRDGAKRQVLEELKTKVKNKYAS